jgi:hypothetical protein
MIENDSILNSIKKLCNIGYDDVSFDRDILFHINAALGVLAQIGVIAKEGILIGDQKSKWTDLTGDKVILGLVVEYVQLKCVMIFDPPGVSAVLDAYKERIGELEWRLGERAEENMVSSDV